MREKMFERMWAVASLILVALCANPAMAQDEVLPVRSLDTAVLTITTDSGVADRDDEIVECDARTPCQLANEAVSAIQMAVYSAQIDLNFKKVDVELAEFEVQIASDAEKEAKQAALRNAKINLGIAQANVEQTQRALEAAIASADAICRESGPKPLPPAPPREPEPPIIAMPSPDFSVGLEPDQVVESAPIVAPRSSANSS